ncbi:MAG: alpha/beta hydrolase [Chitinophagaceae bacterium]|nr:alpha/beta hydrolase [Polaromonas sp.]
MYKEKRLSVSEFVPIRGLNYHVRVWKSREAASVGAAPPLVLVHGWMDVAASYQFMVDALQDAFVAGRTIIAPDWRGFGLTTGGPTDNFWFPDYLADLDFLIDHCINKGADGTSSADKVSNQQVDLLGHSMGGNIAMMYAGVRPERIRRLINLEGFGLGPSKPSQAASRYAKWLDELKSLARGELDLKVYPDIGGVVSRLIKTNPRLSLDKAHWLAQHWARQNAAGSWQIRGEPGHKVTSAHIYKVDETVEIYKRITAPVLAVEAESAAQSLAQWNQGRYTLADYHARLKHIPNAQMEVVLDAGHMLHHDQPDALAALIEGFLGAANA